MEIPFSPGGISWNLRIKSPVLQLIPEGVHIGDVEDQPPPASYPLALFQIEDGRLCVFGAERCEARSLSAVEKFHSEHIPIEPHTVPHVRHPKRHRGNPLNHHRPKISPRIEFPQTMRHPCKISTCRVTPGGV